MSNSTRDILTKPTVPSLGAAGSAFTDPTFGSRMLRVTDGNSTASIEGSYLNGSYRVPASSPQRMWNADATKFFVTRTDAAKFLYTWNAATMTATLVERLNFDGDCSFSRTNANYLYGRSSSYANHQTITRADTSTQPATYTVTVDAEVLIPAVLNGGGYLANVFATDSNALVFATGTSSNDYSHYVVWYPLDNPANVKILDSLTRAALFKTYGIGPYLHATTPDLSGRYIVLTVSAFQARSDAWWVWDTTLDVLTEGTVAPNGHMALGYGWAINQDVFSGTWDAAQWTYRDLATPNTTGVRSVISPVLTPSQTYLAEHGNANNNNATSGKLPSTSAMFRYYDGPNNVNTPPTSYKNLCAWRPWDDEIIQIDPLTGAVTRFCHHRSRSWPEPAAELQLAYDFWAVSIANVSPDGRWAAFQSNWEHTLGMDTHDQDNSGAFGTKHRQDLFIVELIASTGATQDRRVRRVQTGRRVFAR